MVCKVPGCRNDYKRRPELSYFSLPKNKKLQQIWLRFCQLEKRDMKDARFVICSEHFPDDAIEGTRQVEMGLATKKRLIPGAVPTIRFPKKCVRDKKMDRRASKKIVETLLEEYTTQIRQAECAKKTEATEFVEVAMNSETETESESETEIEASSEEGENENENEAETEAEGETETGIITDEHISLIDQEEICEPVKAESSLREKIELLEKENKILKQQNGLLQERLMSMERRYQYEINELKEKLEKAELDKSELVEKVDEMQPMWTIITTN